MILARIGCDRALRLLPIWAIAAGLNTSAFLGLFLWQRAAHLGGSVPTPAQGLVNGFVLVLVGWSGVAIYLAFGHVRIRCAGLDLSLPIPTRTLWLGHVLAVLAGGAVILAPALAAIGLHRMLLSERVAIDVSVSGLAALLGAGLLLATLLMQAPRPSLSRIPVTRGYVLWAVLVLAGIPFLLTAASLIGHVGTVLLVLLAAVIGVWLYRSVPPAFAVVPLEPGPADHDASEYHAAAADDGRRSRTVLPLAILRGVSAGGKELLGVPFILIFGFILGGGLDTMGPDSPRDLRFLYIPMVTYMLFAMIGPRLASLHYMDALPIPRRPLAAALLLPYLFVVVVAYGAGSAASGASPIEFVNFQKTDAGFEVTAPLRVYEVARDGHLPRVGSPWGESHAPEPQILWSGSPAAVYSPYDAPPGSSARFVALQISRAVEHVYGATIPPEEIETRYLITREDGSVVPNGEGLTLRSDYPDLKVRSGPMFPVLLMLAAVPWLLLVAALLRAYRACIREWVRQTIVWGLLGVLLVFFIAQLLATVIGFARPWVLRGLVEIPVMRLGETAAGTFAAWAISTLLIAAAYGLAQSQFLRMEIPTKPSIYTLIDHMRQDP